MENYNKDALYKKKVHLYMEANPNPNSLKFVANFMLVQEGEYYDFPTVEETSGAPLANELFEKFGFIERVFYMNNFITVTKKDDVDWAEVQHDIKDFIASYLQEEKPILVENESKEEAITDNHTEIDRKIISALDEYVKPAVEQDGGAISFHSFNEGTVKVQLKGSCSGCPSSMVTLKAGIENLLTRMIPEVQRVEAEEL